MSISKTKIIENILQFVYVVLGYGYLNRHHINTKKKCISLLGYYLLGGAHLLLTYREQKNYFFCGYSNSAHEKIGS